VSSAIGSRAAAPRTTAYGRCTANGAASNRASITRVGASAIAGVGATTRSRGHTANAVTAAAASVTPTSAKRLRRIAITGATRSGIAT
jgi:hypothetical protein